MNKRSRQFLEGKVGFRFEEGRVGKALSRVPWQGSTVGGAVVEKLRSPGRKERGMVT